LEVLLLFSSAETYHTINGAAKRISFSVTNFSVIFLFELAG